MKVVIMAGGDGKRLRPLTNDIPKPMLPIGRRPILQIIIEQLKKYDLKNIIITTGYKDHIIKSYFKDGINFGVNIIYTYEKNKLGTVGALKILEKTKAANFLVINGDILTKFNFKNIADFHVQNNNDMTVGVCNYLINLPFGVVETNNGDGYINAVKEKPKFEYLILAGIYVVKNEVIKYIPRSVKYDVPDLIQDLLIKGMKIKYFCIKDEWVDIGRPEDYQKANNNWDKWV